MWELKYFRKISDSKGHKPAGRPAWELKYFRKISDYEKSEAHPDAPPLPAFDIEAFGVDSNFKRARREVQRLVFLAAFWILRRCWPVLRIGRTVVVSRYDDVLAVLERSDEFRVPYGPEMRSITGGGDFALGLDGEDHHKQRAKILAAVVQRADAPRVVARTREVAEALIKGSGGRIDVMRDLLARVMMEACDEYFGLDLEEPNAFLDRTFANSALLFADPLGSIAWRRNTLSGAVYNRHVVDRAIEKAEQAVRNGGSVPDTILTRLVHQYLKNGQPVDRTEIRAMAIGTITGLVPTNTLGAAKMLEELKRRSDVFEEAKAIARRWKEAATDAERETQRTELKDILWELSRLSPGLQPGQWRFAPNDAEINGKRIRAGSVLMVATMSALRDHRRFGWRPGRYKLGREYKKCEPRLMFGAGDHACLGGHLAMEQIAEVFLVLFSQDNLRWSDQSEGWLSYIGPFPRRLDMTFSTSLAPRSQEMITIQAPVRPDVDLDRLSSQIAALGNPASHKNGLGKVLYDTNLVHFASLSAFDARDPDDEEAPRDPRLLLELNVDGDGDMALAAIAAGAQQELAPIFAQTLGGDRALLDVLKQNRVTLSYSPWEATGLNFNGTPDCPVSDIEMQEKVAKHARAAIEDFVKHEGVPATRPLVALAYVRRQLRAAGFGHALIRPTRRRLALSEWTGTGMNVGKRALLSSRPALYLKFLAGLLTLGHGALIYQFVRPDSVIAPGAAAASFIGVFVLVALGWLSDRKKKALVRWSAYAKLGLAYCFTVVAVVAILAGVAALACANIVALHFLLAKAMSALWAWAIAIVFGLAALGVEYILGIALLDRGRTAFPLIRRLTLIALAATAAALAGWAVAQWAHIEDELLGQWIVIERLRWNDILTAALTWLGLDAGFVYEVVQTIGWLLFAAVGALLSVALGLAIVACAFLLILRRHETTDMVDERSASLDNIRRIAERENHPDYAMNHILAVTPIKAGVFRRLTLAVALTGIGKLVQYWYRPGFVLNMGTIHYARWFRLPGTKALVFFSNYDGSWESYLEDFITKAHKGQSAAWSNGKGFPTTRFMILDGAQDGSRFKRWVRRQQLPTPFWFSRFPRLTTDQIRNNALIHDGLMRAVTDTAAEAWLGSFGSMPRPESSIEMHEVQALVFRGFPDYPYGEAAVVTLPPAPQARLAHGWLAKLKYNVWFGETQTSKYGPPTFVAFSAAGISKLLHGADTGDLLDSFPPAFRIGMGNRCKILRDDGDSTPAGWEWSDTGNGANGKPAADALVFVYGRTRKECADEMAENRAKLVEVFGEPGTTWSWQSVETQPTEQTLAAMHPNQAQHPPSPGYAARKPSQPIYEHFGFRDGLSQPVIRGTEKSLKKVAPADLIEPGEMILGYRNNARYLAPPLTLPPEIDRNNDLPMEVADFGTRFPRFSAAHTTGLRDFGRNGTFVAVRQFKQHVERFDDFLRDRVSDLNHIDRKKPDRLATLVGCPIDKEWLAGKLMGRTREGETLLGEMRRSDKDFHFGKDDPQGLHCPFGAHIRRANPRGGMQPDDPVEIEITKRHRILRRGRTYQRTDPRDRAKQEKGLLFVALCADIERQFEFLQQTWLSSPSFQGLSNEPDPITTTTPGGDFTIPTTAGPLTLRGLPSFVTVRGGGYFFMPSRAALSLLLSWTDPKNPQARGR